MSNAGTILPPRRDGYPAGPGPIGSLRELSSFFDDPIPWYTRLREEWGDFFGLRAGPLRMTVAFDLDLVERFMLREPRNYYKGRGVKAAEYILGDGLITADGETHRRHRKLAQPVFTPRNVEPFAQVAVDVTRDAIAEWPDDGIASVARACYDISLRTAGIGLFGTDFDVGERARLHTALLHLNDAYRLMSVPGAGKVARLSPMGRRMLRGRDHVDRLIRDIVTQQRRDSDAVELGDLLSRMLAARDDEDDSRMDDDELRDEAVTMLLAGHDTTDATLSWTMAMLAMHPEEQRIAREEVDAVLGGRAATTADLRSLRRVRAVVDESLRLHPTVYATSRDPIESIEMPSRHEMRSGTDLVIPIGAIQRDPRLWSRPDDFVPQRWIDGDGANKAHRLAYMPFGAGPRVCIGSSFALQMLVLSVATILQGAELTTPAGFVLEPNVGFTRRPKGSLDLHVKRRGTLSGAGASSPAG